MTAKELLKDLQQIVDAGNGDCEVLVDVEARHYTCHMVPVFGAHAESEPRPHVGIALDNAGCVVL